MGRDKAVLRLGKRTMLGIIRAAAKRTGCKVREIKRDLAPHCGPLGGVMTSLMTSAAERVLFLACDMPFVSPGLLAFVLKKTPAGRALFVERESKVGFPFVLPTSACEVVKVQIEKEHLSLQALAKRLRAVRLEVPREFLPDLQNINTPDKYEVARKAWREKKRCKFE